MGCTPPCHPQVTRVLGKGCEPLPTGRSGSWISPTAALQHNFRATLKVRFPFLQSASTRCHHGQGRDAHSHLSFLEYEEEIPVFNHFLEPHFKPTLDISRDFPREQKTLGNFLTSELFLSRANATHFLPYYVLCTLTILPSTLLIMLVFALHIAYSLPSGACVLSQARFTPSRLTAVCLP